MPEQEKSCLTCRYAKWDRTASGEINRYGRCLWLEPTVILPKSIPSDTRWPTRHGGQIYQAERDLYTDCPCWEAKV